MNKSLQTFDGIVKSVQDTRKAYYEMSDKRFASMYENRYKVPYNRVMSILKTLKEETKCKPNIELSEPTSEINHLEAQKGPM